MVNQKNLLLFFGGLYIVGGMIHFSYDILKKRILNAIYGKPKKLTNEEIRRRLDELDRLVKANQ